MLVHCFKCFKISYTSMSFRILFLAFSKENKSIIGEKYLLT